MKRKKIILRMYNSGNEKEEPSFFTTIPELLKTYIILNINPKISHHLPFLNYIEDSH
jgi:hypothetical protein